MIKGQQMKTKKSFIPMSILQTTTSANCQGEINLYVEPMFSGFVLMHKNSCRQEGM